MGEWYKNFELLDFFFITISSRGRLFLSSTLESPSGRAVKQLSHRTLRYKHNTIHSDQLRRQHSTRRSENRTVMASPRDGEDFCGFSQETRDSWASKTDLPAWGWDKERYVCSGWTKTGGKPQTNSGGWTTHSTQVWCKYPDWSDFNDFLLNRRGEVLSAVSKSQTKPDPSFGSGTCSRKKVQQYL